MSHHTSPQEFVEIPNYQPFAPMGSPDCTPFSSPSTYPMNYAPTAETSKAEFYRMTSPITGLASQFPGTSSLVEGIEDDGDLEPVGRIAPPFHSSPSEQPSWAATLVQAEYVLRDVAQHFAQALGPAPHSNIVSDSAAADEVSGYILCLGNSSSPSYFN